MKIFTTRSFVSLCRLVVLPVCAASIISLAHAQPQRVPPAPVPAAVAMPRPSDAEVEKARQSFAAYLKGLDADSRKMFTTYPYLLEVRPLGSNSAIIANLAPLFVKKHENNVEVAKAGNIDLLFMGDSITDFWRNETGNYAGKAVFDKYWGNIKTANFGIAGDTTQGVLFRLQNGEGQGFSPKVVMMMIGTNNTLTNRPLEIAEGVGADLLELQKDFPNAKILLLGIFPRGPATDPHRAEIAAINTVISRLHDGNKVFYMDIGKVFLDAAGNIGTDIMSDGLHPTAKGYELWANAVNAKLSELLK
ncbi:MAG: GDSL-type esterase/lipase family protein [Gammaproteobacteria bacterium]